MMLKIYYILELIEKKNTCFNFTFSSGYNKNDIVNEFYEKEIYTYDEKKINGKQNLIQKIINLKNFQKK